MSGSPPGTGRHQAVEGGESDLVDTTALARRRRESARSHAVAIAFTALLPVVVGVSLVVHNHAYWGRPSSTVVITANAPDGTISEVKKHCDAARFTVRAAPGGRTGSFRECSRAYSVGQQLSVVWSPTDPGEADPHVIGPSGVVATVAAVALIPLGLAGRAFLSRRRSMASRRSERTDPAPRSLSPGDGVSCPSKLSQQGGSAVAELAAPR